LPASLMCASRIARVESRMSGGADTCTPIKRVYWIIKRIG
jgi:hypothetical protein